MPDSTQQSIDQHFDPSMFDAYAPKQIAARIETVGLGKASMGVSPTLALSVLAGAFISFGAMFYTVVSTQTGLGLGPARFLGGLSFCLGLILVVVGGAELFTGNVLIIMGWANKKVSTAAVGRNWTIVYIGNLLGAFALVTLAYWSGFLQMGGNAVAVTAIKIAAAKVSLPADVAFVRGVLCNALVCLAVWLCFAARSVVDKIFAIIFPITAFVALGLEHSIANMYFIPMGIMAAQNPAFAEAAGITAPIAANLDMGGLIRNLVPVTLGNIVGGAVFVALSYYVVYLRRDD